MHLAPTVALTTYLLCDDAPPQLYLVARKETRALIRAAIQLKLFKLFRTRPAAEEASLAPWKLARSHDVGRELDTKDLERSASVCAYVLTRIPLECGYDPKT